MTDRMTQAGRDWLDGTLDSAKFFALARREAFGPSWMARLRAWWQARRR